MIRVILVRHGETAWNKERRIQGSASDTRLSDLGLQQAEKAALKLKGQNIQAIYASPLQRAFKTAQAIARYHQLEVIPLEALKEIRVGQLEGVLASTLNQRFDEFLSCNSLKKVSGGESICDVQERAWQAVAGFAYAYPEGTVVAVTHYFVIMSLVCKVLNLPLKEITRFRLSTGTISSFVLDGNNSARLELFNDGCQIN